MNRYKSIGFKLVVGGIIIFTIPLFIVELVSINKSAKKH